MSRNSAPIAFGLAAAFALTACAPNWPIHGAGGGAELLPIRDSDALGQRLYCLKDKIDSFAQQGGRDYAPASVLRLETAWVVAARTYAAGLAVDADQRLSLIARDIGTARQQITPSLAIASEQGDSPCAL